MSKVAPRQNRDSAEHSTETWVTAPQRLISSSQHQACIVHIYPTGPGMGTRYELTDQPIVLGRGTDCQIRINDHSVSRRHARIQPGTGGHYAVDLQSTNGTFVNDAPVSIQPLKDGDYLRVGNCIYRYLAGGNVEAEYHEEIYRLTIIDGLTEIHNKRYLEEFLDREVARSCRHQRPLSLLMMDLDLFREINASLGHLGGDYALREVAGCIKDSIRREELFARYGGEEFTLVLPETTVEGATAMAERVRARIEDHHFEFEGKSFQVTVSIGIAVIEGKEPTTVEQIIQLADEKLYQAKQGGRNRVCC